jgi:hypothetical protein
MFKRATKNQTKLKIALTGPSGSGKTWTALSIATGICEAQGGGVPCLVDTENNSSNLYANDFQFDSVNMHVPYDTEKFITVIDVAEKSGYSVLVIDSLSAQWTEMLNIKARMDSRNPARSFHNWAELTPKHEALKAKIVSANIHIIVTMRSKTEYVMEQEGGRVKGITRVGLSPIQRDGLEYEFSTVLDLSQNHTAVAVKDRTGLFSSVDPFIPGKETGIKIVNWLNQGTKSVQEVQAC